MEHEVTISKSAAKWICELWYENAKKVFEDKIEELIGENGLFEKVYEDEDLTDYYLFDVYEEVNTRYYVDICLTFDKEYEVYTLCENLNVSKTNEETGEYVTDDFDIDEIVKIAKN